MNNRKYECPVCRDVGYVLEYDDAGHCYGMPCKCRAERITRAQLEQSGLAKGFSEKSIDNYETYNIPQLEDAKKTVIQYIDTFLERRDMLANSLMLCGQVGAGKTHLGAACCVQLIAKGIPVVYMGYREVITHLKAIVMDELYYTDTMNRYKKAQVLFIDDFLKGKITEADTNIIYEIVNYRYNNKLPIIISSEKTLEDIVNYDEAIGSRLIDMCYGHIIMFSGDELNYRLYRGVMDHGSI